MPKILCIGQIGKWSVGVFEKKDKSFKKVPDDQHDQMMREHHYGEKHEKKYKGYVYSSGTCKGDSGGPIFTTEKDESGGLHYIVTGIN